MELTLDEALRKGIEAHKAGKVQEADQYYTAILKAQPKHPDANHNMGVLAVGIGKVEEALPFFKAALEVTSDIAQYWLSYINALIRLERLEEARALFDQAKGKGLKGDAFDKLDGRLNGIEKRTNKVMTAQEPSKDQVQPVIDLYTQGKYQEAATQASQLLVEFPNSINLYNIIGAVNQEQGKLEEAIEAYKKALSINPNFFETYNNMGNLLYKRGKLDEAVEALNKAVSIKPDFAEAHNNLGNVLQEQGKFDEGIKAFNKAISIEPNSAIYWNNLFYPLKALKPRISSSEDLISFYPKAPNSAFNQIEISLLDYKLNRGLEDEGVCIDRVLEKLGSAENLTIQNPKFNEHSDKQKQVFRDEIVALVHFGRSGTGLIHSLIDGHPEVSTLPSRYFSEYFDHSAWVKLISGGWDGMVDRFIATYDVLFDAKSPTPVITKNKLLLHNIGIKEGMANVGDQKDEALSVDRNLFGAELKRLMAFYNQLDAFVFFKLVHKAYDKAINDTQQKSIIFYHIHNPSSCAQLNFLRLAPNTKWMVIVREPIQSLESWLKSSFEEKNYHELVVKISYMLNEVGNPIFQSEKSIGVRLEDLKEFPKKTTAALCSWLGIKEADSLYEMTAQGKKWWGNPASPDYSKDGMNPFGKVSINRKLGLILSENDQFILRTLFYPFSVRFGYVVESLDQFKLDLEVVRPMIDQVFDFEKKMANKIGVDLGSFTKSGSYLYLRSQLLERWKILSKYHTYPNMIEPLKIN